MECTPEEIAEKRRIALERLKAKKEALAKTKELLSTKSNEKEPVALTTSKKIPTNPYQNSRILSHPYASKPTSTNNINNKKQQVVQAPISVISCSCYMISQNRFEVNPSAYYNKLIDVFRTIPSRGYGKNLYLFYSRCISNRFFLYSDNSTKLWSFHLNDYNLVHERVNNLNPNVVIGQLPPFVMQIFSAPPTSVDVPLSSLEKTLTEVLMPFQKVGIRFGIEKKGRCLIADEMGLGKTYQALALADFYKNDWPLLVCTTASTR